MHQNIVDKCNKISFSIISVMVAILPFLFLPISFGTVFALKGMLFYVGTFLAISVWLVGQFIAGSITIPKSKTLLFVFGWVVLSFIAALFSKNVSVSLWGRGFVFDSFATTLALGLFAFIVSTISQDPKKLAKLFLAGFLGSVVTVVLQVILYVSQNIPFVANHFAAVSNQGTLVGSWMDFGYFVSFTFLLALLMCEVLRPQKFWKLLSCIALAITLIVMIFLNLSIIWIFATAASLIVFVYKSSVERSNMGFLKKVSSDLQEEKSKSAIFPFFAFGSLLVGLFFFLSASSIGTSISRYAGVSFNDYRPSFGATATVVKSSLRSNPAFGIGPGRFADAWNLYHPTGINETTLWNTSFDSGFSLFESLLSTNGLLPVIALIALFVIAIMNGFKLFGVSFPDRFSRFISVTSLIVVCVFFILALLMTPGFIIVVMSFLYLGMLAGIPSFVAKEKTITLNYLKDPRTSFFAILILVVAIMTTFSAVFFSANKYAGTVFYSRALFATSADSAIAKVNQAIQLSANDVYLQARTSIFTNEFSTEARAESPDKTKLQAYFSSAEASAQAALAYDSTSATNWVTLSNVYQLVINKDKPETAQNAEQAATEASKRAPKNPLPHLLLAQISIAKGDTDAAYKHIDEALALKVTYLDAYVLKAQIKQSTGNTNDARDALIAYTQVAPYDIQGYAVLGNFYVGIKDYQHALDTFTQIQAISPNTPGIADAIKKLKAQIGQPQSQTTVPTVDTTAKDTKSKKK